MFVKLIFKAKRLKQRRSDLMREKFAAYDEYQKKQTKLTAKQKYQRRFVDFRERLKRCCRLPKNSRIYKTCFKIRHNGTCENFSIKSVAGFFGGFCLTYIFFMFFVLQLNFKLSTATIMCSIFGSILTIGLAFSYKVRCIVFLVLPQFFSKKGRQALLAYAFILAITGPAKNTLNNMSILGESLACGQEQLKAAVKQIWEVIRKPFYAIKDAIKSVVTAVKEVVKKIKEILLSIKRIIMSLVRVIKAAFEFLSRIMSMCNKEIGTPFDRCSRVFENAITDCNAKLGPLFNWLCNVTYLVKAVCYVVKPFDLVCMVVDFIKDTVSVVVTKVKQFIRHVRTMFYVRIKFSHSYHFESNHSKSMNDITTGIVTEIKQRSSGLIKIFDFMSCAASLFFIFMVFKVVYYRHKFLTNERFDNKFITKDFRQIDLRRAQLGLETVLPLNHRERQLYITTSSMRLVKKEKSQLSKSAMVLLMATLKLATHMATDYSLYWIMTLIRYYGRFQSKITGPNVPTLNIEGRGFLGDLLRSIVNAFKPIGINMEIDTIPCLPDPIPPDYDRYIQIASLLILCWFLAIFEPYGLRFRHSVMCYYHPYRARERAIWLYNNILRSRSSFLKFARRQLRRKVKGDKKITKVTFMEFIRSKLNCKICVLILGTKKQDSCLLCGEVYRENDIKTFIKCATPGCPGFYCEQCFADLQNICTVCLDPIQYGDMSDVSEERDSSEDESRQRIKKKAEEQEKRKKKKKSKKKPYDITTDTDEDQDDFDAAEIYYKKSLIPKKKKHEKDSDYYSSDLDVSDVGSDYSYSYQNFKDITDIQDPILPRDNFSDIEKQHIPHYASMKDFVGDDVLFDTKNDTAISSPIKTSLEHLNDLIKEKDQGSKLSLLNSPDGSKDEYEFTSTTSTPHYNIPDDSSSPISELQRDPEARIVLNDGIEFLYVKKTNSKISTESIPLEDFSTSTISQRSPITPHTETTFILSPPSKRSTKYFTESSLITELADLREFSGFPMSRKQQKKRDEVLKEILEEGAESKEQKQVHPDVPKLDLNFVDKEVCTCGSSASVVENCKETHFCRRYHGKVRFGTITERSKTSHCLSDTSAEKVNIDSSTSKSDESSSLISSLHKYPVEDFTFKLAETPLSIEPARRTPERYTTSPYTSPYTSNYPDTISHNYSPNVRIRHHFHKDTETDSGSSTNISESLDIDNIPVRYERRDAYTSFSGSSTYYTSSDSTSCLLGADVYTGINDLPRKRKKQSDMYNQRIKDYYKHLKQHKTDDIKIFKTKQGPLKKFLNYMFKSKKNKKGLI